MEPPSERAATNQLLRRRADEARPAAAGTAAPVAVALTRRRAATVSIGPGAPGVSAALARSSMMAAGNRGPGCGPSSRPCPRP